MDTNNTLINIISAKNTSAYNSSVYHTDAEYETLLYVFEIIAIPVTLLALAAFIYGVTSWCLIKQFRHIRNYVLVNVMLANVLRNIFFLIFNKIIDICVDLSPDNTNLNGEFNEIKKHCIDIMKYPFLYCILIFDYWVLVLCYIFYVDFVKVFSGYIRKRYLKSTLFGWGGPFIKLLLVFIISWLYYLYDDSTNILNGQLFISLQLVPVTISIIIYILVIYSLFRGGGGPNITTDKLRRFYIATLIFILSDVMVFYAIQEVFEIRNNIIVLLGSCAEVLNSTALIVYFVMGKSNRILWSEYLKKRSMLNTLELS